jgi:hypothetical protein
MTDDYSTNPDYKSSEERILELESEVKYHKRQIATLERKVDNLVRNESRRHGVPQYGKNVKLPKIPKVQTND